MSSYRQILLVSLTLVILPQVIFSVLDPNKVVYAVDAGAQVDIQSSFGFTYKKDQGFSESKVSDYRENQDLARKIILYTFDQDVFKTERHADNSFRYEIPVTQDGTYVLILQFCEMYFKSANKRVFNIKFGNRRVLEGIDVVSKAGGPFTAHEEYVEFELKEGQVFVKGQQCAYAVARNNLIVEFEKTDKDLPIVNGLVLVKGTLQDTFYYNQDQFKKEWKTRLEEEKRKEEEEKKRKLEEKKKMMESAGSDGLDMYDNEEGIFSAITRILLQKEGFCIMFILFTLAALMIIVKDPQQQSSKQKKK